MPGWFGGEQGAQHRVRGVGGDGDPDGSGGGAGVPGTFTFAPKVKGVTGYTYSFNGEPETTVAAGADGTASVDWTPDSSGSYDLQICATTASGSQLAVYYYSFAVN